MVLNSLQTARTGLLAAKKSLALISPDCMLYLTLAAALLAAHNEVLNSIYWKHSRESNKQKVSDRLRKILFDAYYNIDQSLECLESISILDRPDDWEMIVLAITRAKNTLLSQYSSKIEWKQLEIDYR